MKFVVIKEFGICGIPRYLGIRYLWNSSLFRDSLWRGRRLHLRTQRQHLGHYEKARIQDWNERKSNYCPE